MNTKSDLKNNIYSGKRINREDVLSLFSWEFLDLARAADFRRKMAFPGEQVGFIIDRIINFTNVCEAACSFCAYHAGAKHIDAYEMSEKDIYQKIETLIAAGGTQVMLQGGLHPDHTLETYVHMVESIKKRFPDIYLHSFSPAELVHISKKSSFTIDDVIEALKKAGVSSVPGASDMLVDRIRTQVSPNKLTKDEWCEVMAALHRHDLKSSATMTYGMGETLEEKIEHLQVIRDVQDKTGILRAFIPWSFSPARTRMEHIRPATGMDYLKIVAIGRIFLDNITYIQAGWLTEGLKLAQIALTMGANDMGGVLTEEVVVKATGVETKTNMDEMIDIIQNSGKIPVQRDSAYQVIRKFD